MCHSTPLLGLAVSALIGTPVATEQKNFRRDTEPETRDLDVLSFHRSSLIGAKQAHASPRSWNRANASPYRSPSPSPRCNEQWWNDPPPPRPLQIQLRTLTGGRCDLTVKPTDSIASVKRLIDQKTGHLPQNQQIIHFGEKLADHKTVRDCDIVNNAVVYLVPLRSQGPNAPILHIGPRFCDPAYDRDFTNVYDGTFKQFFRGGHRYRRPCGWDRRAIRVRGRFDGGSDAWLGSCNGVGEWPVSYHGTTSANALAITEEGFRVDLGTRFAFGRGIYSTPNIETAERYAKEFRGHDGAMYKAVLQNRVNPDTLWTFGDKWLSPREEDVRPYGICIKRCSGRRDYQREDSDWKAVTW